MYHLWFSPTQFEQDMKMGKLPCFGKIFDSEQSMIVLKIVPYTEAVPLNKTQPSGVFGDYIYQGIGDFYSHDSAESIAAKASQS